MTNQKPNKVFIGIPSKNAHLHARLVQAIVPQLKELPFVILSGVSPVARARNLITKEFLASDATHLFMVDDDTIPPVDAIEKLLAVDADVVTGVTPILRQGSRTTNIYFDVSGVPMSFKDIEHKKKPFEVRGCGASCILIRRDVLEKIGIPYFAELWGTDGEHVSEDIYFCNRAEEEKFKILCEPTVICKHARTVVI